jgi:uncharacterized membrane protein YcaP (DUF421 family)
MLGNALFFSGWSNLGRTVLVGGLAYAALVLMLRISGKRTLAKMNSFDLVVTVALGSTLATILLNKDVALAEGLTSLALLILLQFVVTWLSIRSKLVHSVARSEPRMLLHRGKFLDQAMRSERVTKSELLQAVRSQGFMALADLEGVVLETDGTFSVIQSGGSSGHSSLANVRGPNRESDSNWS